MPRSVFLGTEYKMDHRKIGRALVINNMRYANRRQRPEREDSIKDASAITNLLETLSFESVTRRSGGQKEMLINDVSSTQLMDIIKDGRGFCYYQGWKGSLLLSGMVGVSVIIKDGRGLCYCYSFKLKLDFKPGKKFSFVSYTEVDLASHDSISLFM